MAGKLLRAGDDNGETTWLYSTEYRYYAVLTYMKRYTAYCYDFPVPVK
jgi:hypothetical protein